MSVFGRRTFLSLAAVTTAAAAAGCAPAKARARVHRSATYLPPSYEDLYPGMQRFLDVADRASGGDLAFDHFHSGSLIAAEQLMSGLLLETADVVHMPSPYVASSFPALGLTQLPFVTDTYDRQRAAVAPDGDLIELINRQLASRNIRVLGGIPAPFEYFWTAGAPIRTPADVAGMRIRVSGELQGETVKALGGAPVFMSSSEAYEALERGTIDGVLAYIGTIFGRDLQNILRYATAAHFGSFTVDAYCRQDWYAAQPRRLRAALNEAGRALYRYGTATMLDVHEKQYLPAVKAGGVEVLEPSGTELEAFRSAVQPVYDRWRAMLGDDPLASRMLDLVQKAEV